MSTGVPMDAVPAAHASNAIWTRLLPAAPSRLLLLGAPTGALAIELEVLGYQVSSHPHNPDQVFAQLPTATRQGMFPVDLPLPDTEAANFDAAVVLDFSPQVHPLALWDQLAHWLADGASVVLVGSESPSPPPRMQHWQSYVAAIAARCGFVAQEVSEDVRDESLGSLVALFQKGVPPRWQVRHVRPVDFDQIATLFQEVFGHPLSRDLWRWKYANGHGNAVVAARHGALIAHYGGMYRDVMLCGTRDWVFQICDVMVHPKERGVMTRQGPFLLTAATSAEMYGPLGFGFPNARAMQVAEKMGLYSEVGQMSEVRWEPASPRFRLRTRLQAIVRGSDASQKVVETVWAAMAQDLREGVVGVRDWAFLEHRYFCHPHNQYDILAVTSRLTGKPLGVMVLRRLEASCELVDVITPLAHLPLLIDQARRLTGIWSLPYLYCWITKNHLQRFLAAGGNEVALNVTIPTSCWTDDARAQVFQDRWWLMSGDTDFR